MTVTQIVALQLITKATLLMEISSWRSLHRHGSKKVALRKTRGLLDAGARVTVVAPMWLEEFESLAVRLLKREFGVPPARYRREFRQPAAQA